MYVDNDVIERLEKYCTQVCRREERLSVLVFGADTYCGRRMKCNANDRSGVARLCRKVQRKCQDPYGDPAPIPD